MMAKTQKIDNAVLKRFERSNTKRKSRTIKVFFLIVSEGSKTEPNYFQKFEGQFGNIIYDIDCEGKGYNIVFPIIAPDVILIDIVSYFEVI